MTEVVSPAEWKAARSQLLEEEKAATRRLDELAAKRRALPMVKVENPADFLFTNSDDGQKKSLLDLFEGDSRQLILYDFMLTDSGDTQNPCHGCSFIMDHISHLGHLRSRDTSFACVASASADKIAAVKKRMGWEFPFYSRKGTFVDGHSNEELTWKPAEKAFFGIAVFLRKGNDVFHSYSTTDRGTECLTSTYALLDMTKLGRQEVGNGITNFRLHDQY